MKADLPACELLGLRLRDLLVLEYEVIFLVEVGCDHEHIGEKRWKVADAFFIILYKISVGEIWGRRAKLVPIFLMNFGCRDLYVFIEC